MLPTITRRSFSPFFMPNVFDEDFFNSFRNRTSVTPAVNIREDDKNYILDLAIPGFDKKDLKIDVNEDVLTIASENSNESDESKNGFKRKEFSYSAFSRSFYVPENVDRDKIDANYKDGILSISLPKQEEDKKKVTRKIEIS